MLPWVYISANESVIADTFYFANVILYGTSAGVLTAALPQLAMTLCGFVRGGERRGPEAVEPECRAPGRFLEATLKLSLEKRRLSRGATPSPESLT